MFTNICKIVFRNLLRYKSYTIINIVGLAIGIASMVWGFLTYQFAFGFDNFHKDRDNVYRALTYIKSSDGIKGIFPMPAVQAAKDEFKGIRAAVRLDNRGVNIRYDTSDAFADQVSFTDPAFFDLFNFPLVDGDNNLSDPNAVLLTETAVKKYFGKQNPIGKTLVLYTGESYARPVTVKGILKDPPINSTIQFSIITGFDNELTPEGKIILPNDWTKFLSAAYFMIPNPADVPRLQKELAGYLPLQNKAREDSKVSGFKFISIRQNAILRDVVGANHLYERPSDAASYGPLALAFLIFLSACLNFSNTTVARANKRLKEIGMRKVMGSTYFQLTGQLLIECAIIVIVSILLSVLLNKWWLPAFNSMFQGVMIVADYANNKNLVIFTACMLIGATLLAGGYPAFYLSRFKASSIFRGSVKFGDSNLFSRSMLGLQIAISIITVVAGIAFANNAVFQRHYNYGYSIENTIGLTLNDTTEYVTLRNALSAVPGIQSLAGTRHHIGFSYRNAVAEREGVRKEIDFFEVGKHYTETMQLKIIAGRGFDGSLESDQKNGLLITEGMAGLYGWNAPQALNQKITIDSINYSVVGVLKDFHPNNLFQPLSPVAMKLSEENKFRFVVIQARSNELTDIFSKVKSIWQQTYPSKPFNGFFQNQIRAEAYQTSDSIASIFSWFAIVSILLTATGLYALVSLTALKRMKEIAVRKVIGADLRHILILINKGYFGVFAVSAVIGCYAGWALTGLLLGLIFKINVGVGIGSLIWSVVLLFTISALISGYKVWQAVRANPVNLLRSE